ncbi:MAG: Gfo/Idh/MocA family oxidoreductase [Chloroflexi bacterium]|nr:Gfo/Idh/MocA family oxidoreductase [Chloroflexota bacterium]
MALKVGVVGMRGIGNQHAAAHKKDGLAELVGVCDIVKERADSAAATHGVRAYYHLQDMLDDHPDLDIVDVCTGGDENGSWHYEPAMEALLANKHVLVEKPLSSEVQQAREMVATAAARRRYLGCNLNHYFTPPAEVAKGYLDRGEMGELVYCLTKMGFQGAEPEQYRPSTAANTRGFPYFHLKAFLSHPLSVMRYFCGDVTHVQAFLARPGYRRRTGDVMLSIASIHVRFANDCTGYLLSQRGDASYGLGGWWSVEVAGTKGTFCIENCIERVTFWKAPESGGPGRPLPRDPGAAGATVTESGTSDFSQTFPRRIHAFLEDVTGGVPLHRLRASGRDALAALEYTWAAMESYEQGGALVRPHPLPPL